MRDFLARMAAASAMRVADARAGESETDLRRRALATEPPPPLALSPDGFDCIAEFKVRTPAGGTLVAGPVEPDAIAARAAAYARGGAVAISVLTEPAEFGGDLDHLTAAAGAVTIPAMRKDFLVDPYQVFEARASGAGGVLLILRILDDVRLRAMLDAAAEAGCFVLLEAFDGADLERGAELVGRATAPRLLLGLNCRDLRTLAVDRERLPNLVRRFPSGAVRVAESGCEGPADAARLAAIGYRVVLVGSAVMRAPDPAAAVAAIVEAGRAARRGGGPPRLRVKICGLTRAADVEAAVAAGADAVGFILAPDSPRAVTPARAAELARLVPPGVQRVAVFRRLPAGPLAEALAPFVPDEIQAECAPGAAAGPWRVVPVILDGPDLLARVNAARAAGASAVVVDGPTGQGQGRLADPGRAAAAARAMPVFLAGGLTPDTVASAIRAVRPAGVDVSGGVEGAPGQKDPARIAAFVTAAREAAR